MFGLFNVHTDADACDCTRGLYRHRKRVYTVDSGRFCVYVCSDGSAIFITRDGETADAETEVPSVENPELTNIFPLKPAVGQI